MSQKLIKELRRRTDVPSFKLEDYCFPEQLAFLRDLSKFKTGVCSRRCLAEGTLVQTALGPKPIQELIPGDIVYSEFGKPVKVKQVFKNGLKKVREVVHNGRVLVLSTEDHNFLMHHPRVQAGAPICRPLGTVYKGMRVVRREVARDEGAAVPYAYAIGALLGDGCCREGGKSYLCISSCDSLVPNQVAKVLVSDKVVKCHPTNFTYKIYGTEWPEEYKIWCHGRYAHEKICDINRILSWDRPSRLAFLAGLIDTDGSVSNQLDGLQIRLSMQAKIVIEAAQRLCLDLWQYEPSIYIDRRPKYKNGPVYNLSIKHNYFSKKILKELTPYLVTEHKKFKQEYEDKTENNFNPNYVGITLGKELERETYDIHVESETNLYMLANGLVTHNSGKTEGVAADMLDTGRSFPEGDIAYITLNRRTAKKIIWRKLLELNKTYQLGAKPDATELTLTMPNGPVLHVAGAKDESEIAKFLGHPLRKVYIDESQSFRPYIKELVEDVLEPTLIDYDGSLALIGTPGPIPNGYFYDAAHNSEGWSNHKWTMHNNPHILRKSGKTPEQHIAEVCKRRGVDVTHPSIQREFFGQWVYDAEGLVFQFNKHKNIYAKLPDEKLEYIFGVDLGFDDADAIAVLGYSYNTKHIYLIEEDVETKQDITSLSNRIRDLKEKYNPVKIMVDSGALGKKINEEIRVRQGIVMDPAEKNRKFEFIELLNDDLRTGKFKAFTGSVFEEDSYLEQWDRSKPGKLKISDTYHSDITMAVLYAWRECKHYLAEKEPDKLAPNSVAYMKMLEEQEAEAMDRKNRQQFEDGPTQEDMDFIVADDWD